MTPRPLLCPQCKRSYRYMEALRQGVPPTVGQRYMWTGRTKQARAGNAPRVQAELRCSDCRYVWWSYQTQALELAGLEPD